jgi:hypothetical protein
MDIPSKGVRVYCYTETDGGGGNETEPLAHLDVNLTYLLCQQLLLIAWGMLHAPEISMRD